MLVLLNKENNTLFFIKQSDTFASKSPNNTQQTFKLDNKIDYFTFSPNGYKGLASLDNQEFLYLERQNESQIFSSHFFKNFKPHFAKFTVDSQKIICYFLNSSKIQIFDINNSKDGLEIIDEIMLHQTIEKKTNDIFVPDNIFTPNNPLLSNYLVVVNDKKNQLISFQKESNGAWQMIGNWFADKSSLDSIADVVIDDQKRIFIASKNKLIILDGQNLPRKWGEVTFNSSKIWKLKLNHYRKKLYILGEQPSSVSVISAEKSLIGNFEIKDVGQQTLLNESQPQDIQITHDDFFIFVSFKDVNFFTILDGRTAQVRDALFLEKIISPDIQLDPKQFNLLRLL